MNKYNPLKDFIPKAIAKLISIKIIIPIMCFVLIIIEDFIDG